MIIFVPKGMVWVEAANSQATLRSFHTKIQFKNSLSRLGEIQVDLAVKKIKTNPPFLHLATAG
ncbi:hypothetical protein [Mesobacillus harenae]|uniref:hypothetical protein n=1 Tax=Mesobacillus harenae TaxID=2213203 RepID=UPI001580DF1E|nr:hypothetical protein [Mesobacillus harenae]